jgi:uncharacterized protein YjbJ (UPF0337 family)
LRLSAPGKAAGNDPRRETVEKDEAKGRIKEAVGDLTDDEELKREGKADRAEGKAHEAVDKAADKVRDVLDDDDD